RHHHTEPSHARNSKLMSRFGIAEALEEPVHNSLNSDEVGPSALARQALLLSMGNAIPYSHKGVETTSSLLQLKEFCQLFRPPLVESTNESGEYVSTEVRHAI